MPIYSDIIKIEKWMAGLIMSLQILTIAIVRPITGTISDRYGRKPFIAFGLAVSATSLVFLPFTTDFYTLLVVMVLHGLGIAITTSSTSPLISEISSKTLVGSGLGALETIKDVGHATGPILAGFLIGRLGYFPAFLTTSLVLILILVVFIGNLK